MRKILMLVFIIAFVSNSKAQSSSGFGIMTGATYYMGDINPSEHFYNMKPMVGGVYRYNFNDTYALRVNCMFGEISASDKDFNNDYQQARSHSFKSDILNISTNFEYNFYPFWAPKKSWSYSIVPFVSLGVGLLKTNAATSATLPMTIGFKWVATGGLTIGLESSFIKTFSDNIDELPDPINTGKSSFFINNDWISYTGIVLTYRFSSCDACFYQQ
jgi:hypothetical protein